jgi:alpha-glucosidase
MRFASRLWLSVALLGCLRLVALEITGPDAAVKFRLETDAAGQLRYAVEAFGRPRLLPARAGILVDGRDLGAGLELGDPVTRALDETFPWRGPKNRATNRCVAAEIPIRPRDGGPAWTLEVRVFNDGAAFRYRVPAQGERHIAGESTTWQVPPGATLWLQTDTDDYEGEYHPVPADRVPLEEKVGDRTRPVHIGPPMTIVYPDGAFGLLTEAALFRYSGLTLRPEGGSRFRAAFEDDPEGWLHSGEILSPWRVLVLARDLNGLVNSDVIAALNEPPDPTLFPDGPNTAWLRPGKAPCTWMVFGNDGANWDKQKWFVDVAAATGCEYLLVDAGWRSERWGWLKDGGDVWTRAAELVRYGAERGVGIVLWHAYPDGRDDSPGLTTPEAREEFFRECARAGVKGVKIDFFNSESRATIGAYEDLLRRAAKHQLLVNFHGANKPTGEARTWPNEITREGIREQEYVLWDVLPLAHYGALPFTRLAAGHADFLPGYLQARHLKNTTQVFQMAAVVVFSSPFLCWPDNPEAYLHSPWLHFVRSVPVSWDETRVLPGSVIGETVLLARRRGEEWYVAALNCRGEPRTLELDLAALGLAGKVMTAYREGGAKTEVRIESGGPPPADGKLAVTLPAGGGFLAHFAPPREFPGWR